MFDLLQTIVIVAGITFWLTRAERLVRDLFGSRAPAPTIEQPTEAVPADLLAQAQSYGSDWARQAATDHLYELHARFKDWGQVRAALAVREGTI